MYVRNIDVPLFQNEQQQCDMYIVYFKYFSFKLCKNNDNRITHA